MYPSSALGFTHGIPVFDAYVDWDGQCLGFLWAIHLQVPFTHSKHHGLSQCHGNIQPHPYLVCNPHCLLHKFWLSDRDCLDNAHRVHII